MSVKIRVPLRFPEINARHLVELGGSAAVAAVLLAGCGQAVPTSSKDYLDFQGQQARTQFDKMALGCELGAPVFTQYTQYTSTGPTIALKSGEDATAVATQARPVIQTWWVNDNHADVQSCYGHDGQQLRGQWQADPGTFSSGDTSLLGQFVAASDQHAPADGSARDAAKAEIDQQVLTWWAQQPTAGGHMVAAGQQADQAGQQVLNAQGQGQAAALKAYEADLKAFAQAAGTDGVAFTPAPPPSDPSALPAYVATETSQVDSILQSKADEVVAAAMTNQPFRTGLDDGL